MFVRVFIYLPNFFCICLAYPMQDSTKNTIVPVSHSKQEQAVCQIQKAQHHLNCIEILQGRAARQDDVFHTSLETGAMHRHHLQFVHATKEFNKITGLKHHYDPNSFYPSLLGKQSKTKKQVTNPSNDQIATPTQSHQEETDKQTDPTEKSPPNPTRTSSRQRKRREMDQIEPENKSRKERKSSRKEVMTIEPDNTTKKQRKSFSSTRHSKPTVQRSQTMPSSRKDKENTKLRKTSSTSRQSGKIKRDQDPMHGFI